jgi:hypothetical protein
MMPSATNCNRVSAAEGLLAGRAAAAEESGSCQYLTPTAGTAGADDLRREDVSTSNAETEPGGWSVLQAGSAGDAAGQPGRRCSQAKASGGSGGRERHRLSQLAFAFDGNVGSGGESRGGHREGQRSIAETRRGVWFWIRVLLRIGCVRLGAFLRSGLRGDVAAFGRVLMRRENDARRLSGHGASGLASHQKHFCCGDGNGQDSHVGVHVVLAGFEITPSSSHGCRHVGDRLLSPAIIAPYFGRSH